MIVFYQLLNQLIMIILYSIVELDGLDNNKPDLFIIDLNLKLKKKFTIKQILLKIEKLI